MVHEKLEVVACEVVVDEVPRIMLKHVGATCEVVVEEVPKIMLTHAGATCDEVPMVAAAHEMLMLNEVHYGAMRYG